MYNENNQNPNLFYFILNTTDIIINHTIKHINTKEKNTQNKSALTPK